MIAVERVGKNIHLPSNSRLGSSPGVTAPPLRGPAVFLDRDGVLLENVHYLTKPKDLRILPGVANALRLLRDRFYLIVVTNQSGIARGFLDEDGLLELHRRMALRLDYDGAELDGIYYCPHLPEAPIERYRCNCDCRKPMPGMLFRAAGDWGIDLSRSFLVGDMLRDIQAAEAAGVKPILLTEGRAEPLSGAAGAWDLIEATGLILASIEEKPFQPTQSWDEDSRGD